MIDIIDYPSLWNVQRPIKNVCTEPICLFMNILFWDIIDSENI